MQKRYDYRQLNGGSLCKDKGHNCPGKVWGCNCTAADLNGARIISRSPIHTYGQPIAHFLRPTAKVSDARIITEHLVVRVGAVVNNLLEDIMLFGVLHNPKKCFAWIFGKGGCDLLGRTKDQIRTIKQVNAAHNECITLKLDARHYWRYP